MHIDIDRHILIMYRYFLLGKWSSVFKFTILDAFL